MGNRPKSFALLEVLENRRHLHADTELANALAINAGGPDYVDSTGNTWEADEGFTTKSTTRLLSNHNPIANTTLGTLFNTSREDFGLHFGRSIPNGAYSVTLYFAEQEVNAAGQRVFDVKLQGKTVLSHLDIFKTTGGQNRALVETATTQVTNGRLDLDFVTNTARATISGVQVDPADGGVTPGNPTDPVPTDPDNTDGDPPPTGDFHPGNLSWSNRTSAPIKREEAESFVSGGKLYVYGGYIDNAYHATTRLDTYDPSSNTWKHLKNGPSKITHAGLAIDPKTGTVWMCGGFIGDFPSPQGTTAVWKYNPHNDSWSKGPSLPQSRGSGGAAIINNTLYFFSGATADRKNDSNLGWSLDLSNPSAKWTSIAPILKARNHFSYATVGGKIYVFGGQTHLESQSRTTSDCEVYDPALNRWFETTRLPTSYSHFSFTTSVYKGRYILFAGGENPHNGAKSEVLIFDTSRRKWATLKSLPVPRRAAAGGIIGNQYVVSGGYLHSVGLTTNTWVSDLTKLDV